MAGETKGFLANMAINSAADFSSGALFMRYISNNVKETIPIEQNDSNRGTRSRYAIDIAQGNIQVGGQVVFEPNPVEIGQILTYFGFSNSSGTYTLTEGLTDLYTMWDYQAKLTNFLLRPNVIAFEGEPGKKLKMTVDMVGKTLTIPGSGSFPSITADSTSRPFMYYDAASAFTYNSVAYQTDKFALVIDNKIEPTYMDQQTATDLEPMDREIKLTLQTKYTSSEVAILTDARAGTARAATQVFTNGGVSITFAEGSIVATSESPTIPGRGKIRMPLTYNCYAIASGARELVITLDAVP